MPVSQLPGKVTFGEGQEKANGEARRTGDSALGGRGGHQEQETHWRPWGWAGTR